MPAYVVSKSGFRMSAAHTPDPAKTSNMAAKRIAAQSLPLSVLVAGPVSIITLSHGPPSRPANVLRTELSISQALEKTDHDGTPAIDRVFRAKMERDVNPDGTSST
jgi:hypothetical protein